MDENKRLSDWLAANKLSFDYFGVETLQFQFDKDMQQQVTVSEKAAVHEDLKTYPAELRSDSTLITMLVNQRRYESKINNLESPEAIFSVLPPEKASGFDSLSKDQREELLAPVQVEINSSLDFAKEMSRFYGSKIDDYVQVQQIMEQQAQKREMLYICSPLRGDVEQNIQNAMEYCAQAVREGYIPIAPHVMYRGMFDDEIPEERAAALEIGLQLLEKCTRMWVCGDETSEGMQGEIDQARRAGTPVEQKPAAYFRQNQPSPRLTFDGLRRSVEQSIRECEQQPDKILDLLHLKAQHHQYSLTNAVAIRQQAPDAQYATTYHEWHKMGYRVKDWRRSIKVWTQVQTQTFLRGGVAVDVCNATPGERSGIIAGEIPVQSRITYRMNLVYDISQTNCPKSEYSQIIGEPYRQMEKDQLYACVRNLAVKCGFEVQENSDQNVTALRGYYFDEKIYISEKLRPEEKLSVLCSSFAQGMVEMTSMQPQYVQEFESKAFSFLLHERFGLPVPVAGLRQLVEDFENVLVNAKTFSTDSFSHLQKAGNFTFEGIDKEIEAMEAPEPGQTAQKEIRLTEEQRRTNQNFMQGIE